MSARHRPQDRAAAARSKARQPFAPDLASLSVDPALPGWRRGTLAAPGSDHQTRPARCSLPVACVRGGDGPGVLLACRDGDSGIGAALAALALELSPDDMTGGCAVVPDASAIAPELRDAFDALLVARSALVIELAASDIDGDRDPDVGLDWSPVAIVHPPAGRRRADRAAEAAMVAFGARESLRWHGLAPSSGAHARLRPDIDLDGTARDSMHASALAERAAWLGVPHVEVRCGRGDARERLAAVRTGCRNVLVDAGVLKAPRELRATRHLEIGSPRAGGGEREAAFVPEIGATVRAGAHGELRMEARPGEDVYAGAVLARLFDAERPRAAAAELLAPRDGVLLARRADGPLAPGTIVALIAEPMQP